MKNKYERLFDKVLSSTKNKEMAWKIIPRNSHSEVIFNSNLVFRLFESKLVIDNSSYKVIFVEKKYADPEHDYHDQYQPEVLIMENNEIVTSLNDSVIERSDLYRLLEIIEESSDRANKLFGKI